jgi:hypothetical protein
MVLATRQKRPTSVHHRKRNGQHHKATKTYTKTYWPYLPLLIIIGLGIGFNSLWAHNQRDVLGYATDMSATDLLTDTNVQRTANGETGLNLNSELDAAAQAKANNMVALDYWSHDTPSGQPPWVFITQAGYNYIAAGENLAYGFDTSQDVITAWMGSPEHRANILDSSYQDVGFGIANSTDYQSTGPETIVVAEYGEPAAPPAPTPAPSTPAPTTPVATSTQSTPTTTSTPASTPTTATPPQTTTATPKPATTTPASSKTTTQAPSLALQARPVSRIQLITNSASPWSVFATSSIATICIVLFLLRHGLIWRRVLRKGERFAIHYHALDIILVSAGVIGFLLTRNAGMIH